MQSPEIRSQPFASPAPVGDDGGPAPTENGAGRAGRGLAFARQGDYERAVAEFSQALRAGGPSASTHFRRGEAYRLQGDYRGALADYDAAHRLDPGDPLVLFHRGMVRRLLGRLDEALADFDAAL